MFGTPTTSSCSGIAAWWVFAHHASETPIRGIVSLCTVAKPGRSLLEELACQAGLTGDDPARMIRCCATWPSRSITC